MAHPGAMTTPHQPDVYDTNSKQILVTRDPVYNHPAIRNGVIVGVQPKTYLVLAIVLTIFNPVLGPVAIIFACEYIICNDYVLLYVYVYMYIYNNW